MTRLFDISLGKISQFHRVLAQGGMTLELVDAVLKDTSLATDMVRLLREKVGPPLQTLFVPLDVQLDNIRRWNTERSWGFEESDFADIDLSPSENEGLVTDLLAVYLPPSDGKSGVQRTYDELVSVITKQHLEMIGGDDQVLLDRHDAVHIPGVRRVKVDLGANFEPEWAGEDAEISPAKLSAPNVAHAEVLAAAAHFPAWLKAMGEDRVPPILIGGYRAKKSSWGPMVVLLHVQSPDEAEDAVFLTSDIYADKGHNACPIIL